jgi:hypothetical protein
MIGFTRITINNMNFPIHLLGFPDEVFMPFGCAFGGRNDIFHVHKSGVTNALIVDNDMANIRDHSEKYPHYRFVYGDGYAKISRFHEEGKTFDWVICDQWTSMDVDVWCMLPVLKGIARKGLIMGLCMKNKHLVQNVEWGEVEMMKRSEHEGGVYWCIFKK